MNQEPDENENGWDYIPIEHQEAYVNNPINRRPLSDQVGYWKDRAKYFEGKTFYFKHLLDSREPEDNSGDWWKTADDDT